LGLIFSLFTPSFLFYCYKKNCDELVEDIVYRNTKLKNFTTFATGNNILFLMYTKKGNPVKAVRLKRFGGDLPTTLLQRDKTKPSSNGFSERMWMEEWFLAKPVNPLKLDEMIASIDWLIDFQNKNQLAPMTKNEKILEVNKIKSVLEETPHLNTTQNKKWIDQYQSYVETLEINKTPEHGDFWHGNILFEPKTHKMRVIDWEYFRKEGNPLFDFIFLLLKGMKVTSKNIEEFKSNLYGSGEFTPILTELKNKINKHFGFELNLKILIPYVMLCFTIRKQLERGPHDKDVISSKKLLDVMS